MRRLKNSLSIFGGKVSIIPPFEWSSRTDFISESLLTSMFPFLLISIRVKKIENVAVYVDNIQKLKELVNLSTLSKFQLFATNNKGTISKLRNCLLAKTLMSLYILF